MWPPNAKLPRSAPAVLNGRCHARLDMSWPSLSVVLRGLPARGRSVTFPVWWKCCIRPVLAVDDRHVAFCEYNGSVARIICVAVATLANEKLLECASDNDLLLCRKSTSNKTRYRQWFDRCIISKMILKSGSNWLFRVVFLQLK